MADASLPHEVALPDAPFDAWGSAPGRVEFIGNHTDYNGGWVLGATIDRRVDVTLQARADRRLVLRSARASAPVALALDAIDKQTGAETWANYVLGVLDVLQAEGLPVPHGFDLTVQSTLPVGAGLSSSAALELAAACALTEMFGGDFDRRALVRLCQRAENEFVGVPCGMLDQAVVACGDADRLVCIDARAEAITSVPFPADTHLWIFRTPEAHALADAHYRARHDEARAARDRLDALLEGGVAHLAAVEPEQLEAVRDALPDGLYRRARHVCTEHRRVQQVVRHLETGALEQAGRLLFASHQSSRVDYENSTPELDFVVNRLAEEDAVLGARLTGAGFGGAVMAWTRPAFTTEAADAVRDAYVQRFGDALDVIPCRPAPGCFGYS